MCSVFPYVLENLYLIRIYQVSKEIYAQTHTHHFPGSLASTINLPVKFNYIKVIQYNKMQHYLCSCSPVPLLT